MSTRFIRTRSAVQSYTNCPLYSQFNDIFTQIKTAHPPVTQCCTLPCFTDSQIYKWASQTTQHHTECTHGLSINGKQDGVEVKVMPTQSFSRDQGVRLWVEREVGDEEVLGHSRKIPLKNQEDNCSAVPLFSLLLHCQTQWNRLGMCLRPSIKKKSCPIMDLVDVTLYVN